MDNDNGGFASVRAGDGWIAGCSLPSRITIVYNDNKKILILIPPSHPHRPSTLVYISQMASLKMAFFLSSCKIVSEVISLCLLNISLLLCFLYRCYVRLHYFLVYFFGIFFFVGSLKYFSFSG